MVRLKSTAGKRGWPSRGVAGASAGIKKKTLRKMKQHPRRHYIDADNAQYPDGAIRGQLKRD